MLVPICDLCSGALLSPGSGPGSELDTGVSSLPCGHVYHTACIRRHVASCYECKVCHCPATIPSISNVKLTAQETKGLVTDMVVLDVLQTKVEDSARENMGLRAELDKLRKEMEGEAVMFNMKVAEFQNQFDRVQEEIRLKNAEIERLRTNDCNRSIATETVILEDTLRSEVTVGGVNAGTSDTSDIYTSLDTKFPPVPATRQILSCLRQFIIIVICVAITLLITIVIPLKIGFS